MQRFLTIVKCFFVIGLVVLLNSVAHVSVASAASHHSNGVSHESSGSSACATLCRSAVLRQDTFHVIDQEDNDDEPTTLYPLSFAQGSFATDKLAGQQRYADDLRPPPKVPVYILYGVFRV